MYAVIETGGKQYRVEVGTELEVELLDVEPGNTITLDRVLLVADGDGASIGQPVVANAAVSAEVLRQARGEKTISFKYRPKARTRVKKGHRQELTVLRISDITLDGKSAAKDARKAEEDAKTERARLEEAAAKQAAADAALAAKLKAQSAAADEEVESVPAKKGRARATAAAETDTAPEAPVATTVDAAEATNEAPEATPDDASADATADAVDSTEEPSPKRSRAAADAAEPAAEDKPKRPRATKKDE